MRLTLSRAAIGALGFCLISFQGAYAMHISNCWIPANAPVGTLIGTVESETAMGAAGGDATQVYYVSDTPGVVMATSAIPVGTTMPVQLVTGVAYPPGVYSYRLYAISGGYVSDQGSFMLYVGVRP